MASHVNISIREATADDAPAVAALKVRAWRAAYADLLPAELLDRLDPETEADAWRERIEAPPPDERLWLAFDGGELVGYARTGPCEDVDATRELGEVHGLYAAPERIGTGVGRALLEHSARDLADRGYATLVLWHFVGNDRAGRFYERAGLRADGTMRHSPHGADEVRLRMPLDGRTPH